MSRENLILIIDDEVQIRRLLEITLQSNGFNICEALNGREGINLAASQQPELIILDTNPVIILSVQSNEEDIVKALDSGANDYLVKPFRTGELLARIRSALRSNNNSEDTKAVFSIADIEIDFVARTVKKKNELIKLTVTEYKLAALFAQHAGKVLTHQYLLREVWGPGYINQSQYLRVFIAQLRKKIEDDPNRPVYIVTESGVGYRFASQD